MKRILTFVFLLFVSTCHAPGFADKKSSGQVSMAWDVFRFTGTCWFLMGTFGHEDYFSDLRVKKSGDEIKYLKAGRKEYMRPAKITSLHITRQPFSMTNQSFSARKLWKAAISVESLVAPICS
jgi:hypothetical protein